MNVEASLLANNGFLPLHRISKLARNAVVAAALAIVAPHCFASAVEEDGKLITPSSSSTLESASDYVAESSEAGRTRVSAKFQDFNGESVAVDFDLKAEESRRAFLEFGYSRAELDALHDKCLAASNCDQQEFDRKTRRYYQEHALRVTPDPGKASRLSVDVAEVVSRNLSRIKPVAEALKRLAAERGYGSQWMVEAAIALVQSGLPYRRPPASADGRNLLGFYPPPMALERGYGDCDTKSALLAAILMNLGKKQIVGVHVPDHYLLGIAAKPRDNEAFITYEGKPYLLVEAAGPARRQPGEISEFTQVALKRQTGVRVDPMF